MKLQNLSIFLLGLGLLGGGLCPQSVHAGDAADEYQFDWLDPDKKVYILQNRKYTKAYKLTISALGGVGFSNPFRNTFNFEPRLGFFFSEDWGVEALVGLTFNQANNTSRAIQNSSPTALPVTREILRRFGGLLHWSPFYAKINVFNKILYFDWYFNAGGGVIQSQIDLNQIAGDPSQFVPQDLLAIYVGTGQNVHLAQWLMLRIDFLASIYSAPIFGNTGDNAWYTDLNLNVGLTFKVF